MDKKIGALVEHLINKKIDSSDNRRYLRKIYKEVKSRPLFIIETMISSNN